MNQMQVFIDYIFYEVWCKAPQTDYDITLFENNLDLQEVITAFHYAEYKCADFFTSGIQTIFLIFKTLNPTEVARLQIWYQSNNNIESLCKNEPGTCPSTYKDIQRYNPKLATALKSFFDNLYSQNFLTLKPLSEKIGLISEHYNAFVRVNAVGKCPFCGLYPIDSEYIHTREAYDHYLPKSIYPFTSINFRNLAPACSKCNSGNKGIKDPICSREGQRRKAFYPYDRDIHNVEISMTLDSSDITCLTPQNISIEFGPTELAEELDTWNDLFRIKDRYKATCCSADAKYWIQQIFDECGEKTPREFLTTRLNSAQRLPYADMNFLRKAFLEACRDQHIFE